MKQIEKKDTPEVSGGQTLPTRGGECFPPFPSPIDEPFPKTPMTPVPIVDYNDGTTPL